MLKALQDVAQQFHTSFTEGLSSQAVPALREVHGYNEFSVETPEPAIIKFVKGIYEQPLILLLFGSAIISAIMHNIDDAVSITIAILIVLTGMCFYQRFLCLASSSFSWIRSGTSVGKIA